MNDFQHVQETRDPMGSVSLWIHELKNGDEEAARQIWQRYVARVNAFARKRLGVQTRHIVDDEDVAQSVFRSLYLGVANGEFSWLVDRGSLWPLLATITRRKTANLIRRENRLKRGGGRVRGESELDQDAGAGRAGLDQFPHADPPPDFTLQMIEECQRLLIQLPDDTYRFIVGNRLEGRTNDEIAELLGITKRSVERKLQLVREFLSDRASDAET
jgi:RNA polymerase sigma factor (sigma-70 family)